MSHHLLNLFSKNTAAPTPTVHLAFEEGTGTSTSDIQNTVTGVTLAGGASWAAPGKVGSYCVDLDGTDGHIIIPHNAALETMRSAISVAMWVNPDALGGLTTFASRQSNSSPYPAWDLRYNGTLEVSLAIGGVNYTAATAAALTTAAWQHIGFSYDGETVKLYIGGAPSGTPNTTPSGPLDAAASTDIWIGGNPSFPAGRYLNGKTDEFRMFGRSLSDAEWASLLT